MAKFRFGLEPVLRQRAREEEDRQRVVAGLERQRIAIEDEIKGYQSAIEAERSELTQRLGDASGQGVDLGAVRVQANASLHLITMAQRAALRLAGVYERLDTARLELLEASTRRKAVETLKDQRYESWRSARSKEELAALDELAVIRHARPIDGDDDDGIDGEDAA
ncbi:MAG: flagellar FliJ family protein [Planctomycetota bacterium]